MKSIVGFFILLQIAFSWQAQVTVSVFYETVCADSIKFITEQLVPTWKLFGGAGNPVFVIDYVPYGKANEETDSEGVVTTICHHGKVECRRNIEHACAIKYLLKPEITPFINCSLLQNVEICTEPDKLDKVMNCALDEGKKLLIENGERTKKLSPPLTYVPWVLFDGVFSQTDLDESQKNLTEVICKKTKACGSEKSKSASSKSSFLKSNNSLYIIILTIVNYFFTMSK